MADCNVCIEEHRIETKKKESAPGEDRTHDLQIMRLTLYRLSHRGENHINKTKSYSSIMSLNIDNFQVSSSTNIIHI